MGSSNGPTPPSEAPQATSCPDGSAPPCSPCPTDFVVTAPDRILKASGNPVQFTAADLPSSSGGSFAWSTASAKIRLTGANSATVTVQGLAQVSASRDAEEIIVTRTQAAVRP